MAHDNEVPDLQKGPDHLLKPEDWETVRADAAVYAAEDVEDLRVPEPDEEDWEDDNPDSDERDNTTPDEMSRAETLRGQ